MAETSPGWVTCVATDPAGVACTGIQVGPHSRCLRHLDPDELATILEHWRPGRDLDVRGTTLTPALLDQVLTAVTDPETDAPRLGAARLQRTTFDGVCYFNHTSFAGPAEFDDARFEDTVAFDDVQFRGYAGFEHVRFAELGSFEGARFGGETRFDRAQFSGDASFTHVQFAGNTTFNDARIGRYAGFDYTQFGRWTTFDGVAFSGNTGFDGSRFSTGVTFDNTRFTGDVSFEETAFGGVVWFGGAHFGADVGFGGARFGEARSVGPMVVKQCLSFDGALFERPVEIHAAAASVRCRGTRFAADAALRLRYADVYLDGATCATLISVAAAPQFATSQFANGQREELSVPEDLITETGRTTATPRLVSLRGTDAARLLLTDVDLSHCRFAEARQLDQIRIDGHTELARTPRPGRWRWGWAVGAAWPGVWRWSNRRVLAEERRWRLTTRKSTGWAPRESEPVPQSTSTPLEPARIEAVYRELRRAQESRGNGTGTADLYYGELEMRRHSSGLPFSERLVLAAYWAVSGYGLRATRSLLWLAAAIAAAAALLQHAGFTAPVHPGYLDTLLYSARATVFLDLPVTGMPVELTRWGQVVRIALRIAGPVCLALAALALRARVRR